MRPKWLALPLTLSVCLLGSVPSVAHAAPILLGQVVETTYLYPDTLTVYAGGPPTNATVGADAELPNFAGLADIDFSDTNIRITLTRNAGINNVAFDGFRFFDVLGTIPDNLIAVLNPSTNYAGFTANRIQGPNVDTLLVNVANLPGLQGQFISIDLVQTAAAVPEPASMLLLGTGLVGIGARRWRNRRKRA